MSECDAMRRVGIRDASTDARSQALPVKYCAAARSTQPELTSESGDQAHKRFVGPRTVRLRLWRWWPGPVRQGSCRLYEYGVSCMTVIMSARRYRRTKSRGRHGV